MAGLLLKISSRGFHCSRIAVAGVRADGWWIKDHRARKIPENEEERRMAALRYGLRPEDYKPYDPSEQPSGDYPDLGVITYDHKDPYENWSHDKHRRNWGEPVGWDWDKYRPDRTTFTGIERDVAEGGKPWQTWLVGLAFYGSLVLLGYVLLSDNLFQKSLFKTQLIMPIMPKQYPYDFYRAWPFESPTKYPILNYTFEPADENEHH